MEDRLLSMQNVLSIRELRKAYGEKIAVDGISFEVDRHEIVGLLGPNGAGKTTTISMVLGVLQPDSGSIYIEGLHLSSRCSQALERTNFSAVYAPLPGNLTVQQNLRVFGLLYGVKGLSDRINALVRQFNLAAIRNMWPANRLPWNKANVLPPRHRSRASVFLPASRHPGPVGAHLRLGRH